MASVTAAILIAAFPFLALILPGTDNGLWLVATGTFLLLSAAGNILIGLPVGLLVLAILRSQSQLNLTALLVAANGAAIALSLLIYAGVGPFGLIFYAVPAVISANVLAVCGWYWAVKPSIFEQAGGRD